MMYLSVSNLLNFEKMITNFPCYIPRSFIDLIPSVTDIDLRPKVDERRKVKEDVVNRSCKNLCTLQF